MAFVNLEKQLFENTTVMLKPHVTVISSSVGGGVTGSAHIYPVRSKRARNFYTADVANFLYDTGQTNAFVEFLGLAFATQDADYLDQEALLAGIDFLNSNFPNQTLKDKTIPICRFDSPTFFNKEHTIINNIVKVLQPHHQHRYPDSGLHYGNYHTLNFFTGSGVPDDACLIYPNVLNRYHPTNKFSLDFWINPRYDNQIAGSEFHAGTIFHMSSSIALSLVSGSQTDEFGKVSSFKLLLQLSQSADYNPKTVDLNNPNNSGVYPRDLIFTSSHELKKNNWHHICVRWGGQFVNNYSGSIIIDDNSTTFVVPSSSIKTRAPNYDTVVIGNYQDAAPGFGQHLFNSTVASDQGLYSSWTGGSEPSSAEIKSAFTNRLNAEIHDIKLFHKFLNDAEIEHLRYNGISLDPVLNSNGEDISGTDNLFESLRFYVPAFFFPYRHKNRQYNLIGIKDGTVPSNNLDIGFGGSDNQITSRTWHPFNVDVSYRQALREINLENFVIEFRQALFGYNGASVGSSGEGMPRLQSLSASVISANSADVGDYVNHLKTLNYFSDNLRARNLSILPNDNGLFKPDYKFFDLCFQNLGVNIINEEEQVNLKRRFGKNSYDCVDISEMIYGPHNQHTQGNLKAPSPILESELNESANDRILAASDGSDGTLFDQNTGVKPDSFATMTVGTGIGLTQKYPIASRTRTTYSNQMTVFDMSNLYYGNRINPGSFEIYDNSVTGSNGILKIRLKDNEHGSLYRADCLTKQATWNNVGDIYYDEGLALIKSPHMSFYCKDRTEISLTGEQNLHTLIMNIPVEMGLVNSSSNATFKSMPPSENINDADKETVYITGVNIHDNNFNIIMKAQFAQPIIKADDDEFIIRLKQDF